MQTEANTRASSLRRRSQSATLSRFLPFWKDEDDDDDNDPKGPPSAVALWFLPLLRPNAPALA